MKLMQHKSCLLCKALVETYGYGMATLPENVTCTLGYKNKRGFMPGFSNWLVARPDEPCPKPMQKRTLSKAPKRAA